MDLLTHIKHNLSISWDLAQIWFWKNSPITFHRGVEMDSEPFKRAYKGAVSNKFIEDRNAELNDTQKNPLLRTYKQIKTEFTMEPYLDLVQNYRYPKAISSIKTSSHTLAVEYGRHHNIPLNSLRPSDAYMRQ